MTTFPAGLIGTMRTLYLEAVARTSEPLIGYALFSSRIAPIHEVMQDLVRGGSLAAMVDCSFDSISSREGDGLLVVVLEIGGDQATIFIPAEILLGTSASS
jgi:hypothetical protein